MIEFEIYFRDLKPIVRRRLLDKFGTTRDQENWDVQPIAVVCREDEEENNT